MAHQKKNRNSASNSPLKATTRREFVRYASLLLGSLPAVSSLLSSPLEAFAEDAQAAPDLQIQGDTATMSNTFLAASWNISPTGLEFLGVEDRLNRLTLEGPNPSFSLTLSDGSQIESSAMRRVEAIQFDKPGSGLVVTGTYEDAQRRIRATWRAILRSGARYIRQEVKFEALKDRVPITRVVMLDLNSPSAQVAGSVKGSPVTSRTWLFGFEHPLSQSRVDGAKVLCVLERQLPLEHGRDATYSSVIGTTAPGQLRRDFLRYIESERAHRYRTFLHYNSWYDLGYFTPYDQAGALEVINAFGAELHAKRNVTLDSFLFDDGWDTHKSLWDFNSGFPNGFAPLKTAAAKYGAAPGIWLSPWGGYDGPRKERLEFGKEQGYEENEGGFVLSGPRYFERFREVCLTMIRTYGINQFKLDGTGNASAVYPGSKFDSDFDAMIHLIGELRTVEPNLYVNLTTGTYPSPFWLRYADSIWRGGDDHSFAGVGSNRQRWITYRDADTHEHIVRPGPLYPLNSLMLHGMIYARYAKKLNVDPGHDFSDEVRSYFGTGTQLQEMYITHSLLSDADWDALAEAARWSRRNADILVDTHWIGGDPARLEVYGWASWAQRGGIITLRNPDKQARTFELDPNVAFELPPDAPRTFVARRPWKKDAGSPLISLRAGQTHAFELQPFEVLTLEAAPQ